MVIRQFSFWFDTCRLLNIKVFMLSLIYCIELTTSLILVLILSKLRTFKIRRHFTYSFFDFKLNLMLNYCLWNRFRFRASILYRLIADLLRLLFFLNEFLHFT